MILGMKKILIIEDDLQLQSLLQNAFQNYYHCSVASSLAGAYALLDYTKFDLLIVDRKLPDGDGLEIIEYLHDTVYQTKLLALTSQAELPDRLEGLEHGADDYLAKPFALAELKIKVSKLLKLEKRIEQFALQAGPFEFVPGTGMITLGEREIHLRKREAEIFHCLLRYKNQVVTRDMLINDVWEGKAMYPSATTLDVYIRRIRVLLQEYSNLITTVRGFGYKFVELE